MGRSIEGFRLWVEALVCFSFGEGHRGVSSAGRSIGGFRLEVGGHWRVSAVEAVLEGFRFGGALKD